METQRTQHKQPCPRALSTPAIGYASNWINLAQQLVAAVKAASPSTKVDVAAA
ncbi:MAG: hypothetical protein M1286_01070 [Candidatus Marsarchaeota archaeon]|nr:hypothetical protein [Candidatus Marsarchaeota archaeon]